MSSPFVAGGFISSPLYKEVKSRLTQSLVAGAWRSGEALPSETKLAAQFKVSIGTIRKAIDELVAEKILVRQQGRGTFVATHNEDRTLFYFFHMVGRDGFKEFPTTELVSFREARADAGLAASLRIERGAPVFKIRNLLTLGGESVIVDDIAIPEALFPDLTEKIFRERDSTVYGLYQSRYGINVIRASERLRASLCDAACARLLRLTRSSPVLEIHRIAYSYNDLAVEFRLSRVNTTGHDYLSELG